MNYFQHIHIHSNIFRLSEQCRGPEDINFPSPGPLFYTSDFVSFNRSKTVSIPSVLLHRFAAV